MPKLYSYVKLTRCVLNLRDFPSNGVLLVAITDRGSDFSHINRNTIVRCVISIFTHETVILKDRATSFITFIHPRSCTDDPHTSRKLTYLCVYFGAFNSTN